MQKENKTSLEFEGGKNLWQAAWGAECRAPSPWHYLALARERHIGAAECQIARHKEPEFIIHVQPRGLWASRAKKESGKEVFLGDRGCMCVLGGCRWLHGRSVGWIFTPPILYLSEPGEGLSALQLKKSSLPACQLVQFSSSGSYLTPATLATRVHEGGASLKPESLSSWQPNQRRDGSLMDGPQAAWSAASRFIIGQPRPAEDVLASHQPLMLVIRAHLLGLGWWSRRQSPMMFPKACAVLSSWTDVGESLNTDRVSLKIVQPEDQSVGRILNRKKLLWYCGILSPNRFSW